MSLIVNQNKSLVNKANKMIVGAAGSIATCPDFHSCEYEVSFNYTGSANWDVHVTSGCYYKKMDTACIQELVQIRSIPFRPYKRK